METRPKGYPLAPGPDAGWNVFDGAAVFPTAVLIASALERNAAAMRTFCARHGVSLAPHGKTTMAPLLFRRQLDDGAWAITAATVRQAAAMRAAGVARVLIANEVVVPAEVEWIADARQEGLEIYCYVDSTEGVEIMAETLARAGAETPLPVLVERGVVGGRSGVRTVGDGLEVAAAVAAAPQLALTGAAGFEGIIVDRPHRPAAELVDEFLDGIVELVHAVAAKGWFTPAPEVIVSAGGSTYFDRVVDRFAGLNIDAPLRVVLRSGCYLTHDDGMYAAASPFGDNAAAGRDDRLAAAIEVWGAVLSRPEPTRAIVGVGKRDVSHDGLLPVAKKVFRRRARSVEAIPPRRVSALNDQHAYLDLDASDPLVVGDLIGFGISHPCTTFDKWRALLLVDDEYNVTATVETEF